MRQELIDLLKTNGDIGPFLEIMDLEDEKFDAIFENLQESLLAQVQTPEFENEIIRGLKGVSRNDMEKELQATTGLLKAIAEDETLSDNKKSFLNIVVQKSIDVVKTSLSGFREKIKVKVEKLSEKAILPEYANDGDAGADICSTETITIKPHSTVIIPSGLKVAVPNGYEIQIRPRSGLSLKTSLRIANALGTIKAA